MQWRRHDAHPVGESLCASFVCGVVSKGMANKPIFFDASGRRAARIKILAWAVGIALFVISVGFAASLALSPPVAGLAFPGRVVTANPAVERRAQKPVSWIAPRIRNVRCGSSPSLSLTHRSPEMDRRR